MFDVTADDEDDEVLSIFDEYITIYPDLVDTLNDDKEITVFAPTNEAFLNLGSDVAPDVAYNLLTGPKTTTTMWKDHLEDLLNYHVLPIIVPSSNITDPTDGLKKSTTLNNEEIIFTLGEATDEEDTGIFVNTDAEVIDADIDIINGIVHVIDNVLLPPWVNKTILDIVSDENPPAELPDDVNVDLVKLNETLEEVFKEAGPNEFDLPNILDSPGGYTVFAPTSAAFLKDALKLKDLNIDQLSSVLSYHVVEGVYPESVLVNGLTLTTLQGEKIRFTSITDGSGTTMVNDETIITPNILANNGIVHVIDGVLIPDG